MARQIKNAAVLHNVNEVSLLGAADLEYWRRRLEPEQLEPVAHEGRAQLLVIAADAKFMGLRFRELSFSVIARDTSGLTNLSGSYLIRAFNSRRSFAWIERTFFHTPYYFGDVRVEAEPPSFSLQLPEHTFRAKFDHAHKNPNIEYELSCFQGPVFLPNTRGVAVAESQLFFAHLCEARVEIYFDAATDVFSLPSTNEPPFPELRESNFSPRSWICGTKALHSKSKTYTRGKCPAFTPVPHFIA